MVHTVNSSSKVVATTSTNYLNMTNTPSMDKNGFWYEYKPVNVNNDTLGASIVPRRWGDIINMPSAATEMQIEGTLSLITDPWNGSNIQYHNGCIVHIGAGQNDITNTSEADAIFFAHLGSLSPAPDDDAYYWDRMYLPIGGTEWEYYQFHKHLPSFYPQTENNRSVIAAADYIRPADKAFGYCIQIKVKVSGVDYQSALLRVHTPSVGGAHNSHNDITLPQTNSKNYQIGGLIKGAGDRYHVFYISANGTNWDIFSRTYVDASASCTSEVLIGTYNLADPTFNVVPGQNQQFPIRATVGDYLNGRIYFPVILNNITSGFDLEIWSFESATSLSGSTLQRFTIISGSSVRPDCHLITVGGEMHATATNVSASGVTFYVLDNGAFVPATNGTFITNGANPLRVHGVRFNQADISYYVLLSGTSTGTGTYTGPGMYKFDLVGDFPGYKHLDYDYTNNSFIIRNALTAGYLSYDDVTGYITRYNTTEPEGIAANTLVLTRGYSVPEFFNREVLTIPESYIYQGFKLADDRKILVGRVEIDEQDDLLITIVSQNNAVKNSFYFGGTENGYTGGTDYVTGAFQSKIDPNKVWMTGYCKSELVERKDIRIQGYCRRLSDSPNDLCNEDILIDSEGSVIVLTNDETSFICYVVKYDNNYNLLWQTTISNDSYDNIGKKITIDSNDNLYVIGSFSNGNDATFITKLNTNGEEIWSYQYKQATGVDTGTAICIINTGISEVIAASINNGTNTHLLILNLNGERLGQNTITDLVINNLRKSQSENNKILFAGYRIDTPNVGKFGMCIIEGNVPVVKWASEFAEELKDIVNISNGAPKAYAVVGAKTTNAIIAVFNVTESIGVYTVSAVWSKTLNNTVYNSIVASPYTETNKYLYAVGTVTNSGVLNMGGTDGIIAKYTSAGTLLWQNAFGHDMMEMFNAATFDMYNRNILICGCSNSHSLSQNALFFRCESGGFGTGNYHLDGNTGMPYYYLTSSQTSTVDATSLVNLTAPASVTTGLISKYAITMIYAEGGLTTNIFDGSYGPNGVFMVWWGFIELDKVQQYLNTLEYKERLLAGEVIHPANSFITLFQAGTVGDGSADDGNIFGYDIIEASNGIIYVACQTSGDVSITNLGTSGVYDGLIIQYYQVEVNGVPQGTVNYYQSGSITGLDEEIYALIELANGKIAFCGRTSSDVGGVNYGGYDIALGIFDPTTTGITWYQYGSGLNDRAFNLHDLGNNIIALTYVSSGALGNQTHVGAEDIGIVLFNYDTETWGNAYQVGTTGSDLLDTQGKPSVLLGDGRIAVAFSTAGNFNSADPTNNNAGFLDLGLAIFDPSNETWQKAQMGSQASELITSISAFGETLLITGFSEGGFKGETEGIYIECETGFSIKGLSKAV